MIATLLLTMMMALGVATGNVSSNVYKGGNAFNTELENKPQRPIKKAVDIEEEYYFQNVQTYSIDWSRFNKKYYLYQNWNDNGPNITNNYYNIYNTTYFLITDDNVLNQTVYNLTSIFKITTYFQSSNTRINLNQSFALNNYTSIQTPIIRQTNNFKYTDNLDQYIDITLTEQTVNTINSMASYANTPNKIDQQTSQDYLGNIATLNTTYTNIYAVNNIPENSTIYVVLKTQLIQQNANPNYNYGEITPNAMSIQATIITPQINYEVIDVPNLMFTILVMPFSFISTAFNLTIFPNTPYQLNFGNLFLTILSIFILLWLLKKVFK